MKSSMKYAKKPVVIEAVQWTGLNANEIRAFAGNDIEFQGDALFIHTLEGSMRASLEDYVIKGVKGEFYACKPDIFEMTYATEAEIGEFSDGYHTYNELYDFRKMYNAALFNEWAANKLWNPKWKNTGQPYNHCKYDVHKSWKHHDGKECFGGGWFIVVAMLPDGMITNHYKEEDWDLFQIPVEEKAKYPFDGHNGQDVLERLRNLSKIK
jgi:hypothetical protein